MRKIFFAILFFTLNVSTLFGQTVQKFRNTTGDKKWDNPANWEDKTIPAKEDIAEIYGNCVIEQNVNAVSLDVRVWKYDGGSLTIDGTLTVSSTSGTDGSIQNHGVLTVNEGGKILIDTSAGNPVKFINRPYNVDDSLIIRSGGYVETMDFSNETNGSPDSYVIIEPGGQLNCYGIFTNEFPANTVTIQSDNTGTGSLICTGTAPAITVEMYVTPVSNHLISPPINNMVSGDFYVSGQEAWLSSHDETNNAADDHGWSYITSLTDSLETGKGYSYWLNGSANTFSFAGTISTADVTKSLTLTGTLDQGYAGFNLIGNPFTSPINWNSGNWTGKTETSGAAYVWDPDADNGNGAYLINGGGNTATFDGIIPAGQGFFVEATTDGVSLNIPADARINGNNPLYKSTGNDLPGMFIRIELKGTDLTRTTFIGFHDNNENNNSSYSRDASVLFSSSDRPEIFTKKGDRKLCINSNEALTTSETQTIPLYLVQMTDGKYTLQLSDIDQLPDTKIILEDLKTGILQDMNESQVYNFTASSTDDLQRFLVHFKSSPNSIEEDESKSNINIYSYGNNVYVQVENINQNGKVYVYDLMGRKIAEQNLGREQLNKVSVNKQNSYVIVKVINDGLVKTEKVFIN